MSESARVSAILRALYGFFDRFMDAYAEGCVPQGAQLPYITYPLLAPEPLETESLRARVYYRSRRYAAIAAILDEMDAVIGAGLRIPTENGGGIWLYEDERFIEFDPGQRDADIKCATLSMKLAANTQ